MHAVISIDSFRKHSNLTFHIYFNPQLSISHINYYDLPELKVGLLS